MSETTLRIGSITHGTARPQDILPALLEAVGDVGAPESEAYTVQPFGPIPAYAFDDDDAEFWESDEASELMHQLMETLQDYVPPYCYVGAHPDDGSDIGVWPHWDAIEMAEHDGEILRCSEVPDCDSASQYDALLVVSDHGNATLYVTSEDGYRWREAWAIV